MFENLNDYFLSLWNFFSRAYRKFVEFFGGKDADGATLELMEAAIRGKFLNNSAHNELKAMFKNAFGEPEMQQKVFSAKNHLERVQIVKEQFPDVKFQEILAQLASIFTKDRRMALLFEKKVCHFVEENNWALAVRCVDLALLFSPNDNKEGLLGSIFGARAALFADMGENEICLRDIQLALSYGIPELEKSDLLKLKSECEMSIPGDLSDDLDEKVVEMRNYRDNFILKISGSPNVKIPSARQGVRLCKNENKGRFLVTDVEMKAGTTIIVESANIATLVKSVKWDTNYCTNCFSKMQNPIPCNGCVFVSFCSDDCRQKYWEQGHNFECGCFSYMYANHISPNFEMCLKAICRQGPHRLFQLWEEYAANCKVIGEIDEAKEDGNIPGTDPLTGKYNSDSYHQILHLKSHLHKSKTTYATWIAISMIKVLDATSNFFQRSTKLDNPDFKDFVTTIFVQHATSYPCNAISVNDVDFMPTAEELKRLRHSGMGIAIYPVITMMSHSCDASVSRFQLPDGSMAMITNRNLSPGDELTHSYGFGFLGESTESRRPRILKSYKFLCDCIACTSDWKSFADMTFDSKYLCPNCSDRYKDSLVTQVQQCILDVANNIGFCTNCQTETDMTEILEEEKKFDLLMSNAETLLAEKNFIEAIPILQDSIGHYQSLAPPSKKFILAQLMLNEAISKIIDI